MTWTTKDDSALLETFEKLGSKAKVKDFKAVLDNQKLTAKQIRSRLKHLLSKQDTQVTETKVTESVVETEQENAIDYNPSTSGAHIKQTLANLTKERKVVKTIDLDHESLPRSGTLKKVVASLGHLDEKKPLQQVTRNKVERTVQKIELLNKPSSPITRRAAKLQIENQENQVHVVPELKEKFEKGTASATTQKSIGLTPSRTAALKSRKVSRPKPEIKVPAPVVIQEFQKEPTLDFTPSREAAVKAKRVTRSAKSRLSKSVDSPQVEKVVEAVEVNESENVESPANGTESPLNNTATEDKVTPKTPLDAKSVDFVGVPSPVTAATPFIRKLRYDTFSESPLRKSVSAEEVLNEETNPFSIQDSQSIQEPCRKRKREDDEEVLEEKRVRLPGGTFVRAEQHVPARNETWIDRTWSRFTQSIFLGA